MKKIILSSFLALFCSSAFSEEVAIYNQLEINEDSFDTRIKFMDHEKCQYTGYVREDKQLIDKDNMYLIMFPNAKKIKIEFKEKMCGKYLFKYENELKIGFLGNGPIKIGQRFYLFEDKELDKK